MGKQVWYKPVEPKNFASDVSVRASVRTDSGGGRGESQDNPTGGGGMSRFFLVAEVNNMVAGSLTLDFQYYIIVISSWNEDL